MMGYPKAYKLFMQFVSFVGAASGALLIHQHQFVSWGWFGLIGNGTMLVFWVFAPELNDNERTKE